MGLTWRSCIQRIMIDSIITSKMRIKLLLKFFLNPDNVAYLRGLESEFGDSSNSIRLELNRLEKANMLTSKTQGNKKMFQVNQKHPMFSDINSIVKKYFGLDKIIDLVISRLGDLNRVYLTGDLAYGHDSDRIDLTFEGMVNEEYLSKLIKKLQKHTSRK